MSKAEIMKEENKKPDKQSLAKQKDKTSQKGESAQENFPGYPHYPPSEDIYNNAKEVDLHPDDLSKVKKTPDQLPGDWNEKSFPEDMTGEDLDVPGSKDDEAKANSGKEDEENNYYSLGGDRHNDLEEDHG